MAEIAMEKVTKTFPGGTVAVRNACLRVGDRELVALVGPSGCGKSTMLRMIAGLEDVSEGTISIGGRVVNDMPPKDRDVAMVFQNYALYPHMTVYDNMAFGLKMRRVPRPEIRSRVSEAAGMLGITSLLERRPKELSGGQRQRVALGRAIVRSPQAFLLDEPLSNLDARLRGDMRAELNRLHQRLNATMVYVTHDQMEAMTLGDRIVVLKDGEIQQVGKPLDIYDRPANKFVAGFIGAPPMNFIKGTAAADGSFRSGEVSVKLPGALGRSAAPLAGRPLTLGVRPEDVIIGPGEGGDGPRLKARVSVVEPLGHEQILYLDVAGIGGSITGKADAHSKIAADDRVEMTFRSGKMHIFDDSSNGSNVTVGR